MGFRKMGTLLSIGVLFGGFARKFLGFPGSPGGARSSTRETHLFPEPCNPGARPALLTCFLTLSVSGFDFDW